MKKNHNSFRNSGAYTSPGTPDYDDNNGIGGIPRGWYSERVPLQGNGGRRHISAAALMPFNSGRTLPSKWDDAERWITSPVTSYGVCQALVVPAQHRPKSKSGPLGNPAVPYSPNYSPAAVQMLENGGISGNFNPRSPFSTGVLVPDGVSVHYGGGIGVQSGNVSGGINGGVRSTSALGWSDLLSESSIPSSQDEKYNSGKDTQHTSPHISRKDMATQMSPTRSPHSSPEKSPSSLSTSPPPPAVVPPNNHHDMRPEVRDVEVDDKGTNMTRLKSKGDNARITKQESPDNDHFSSSCPWNAPDKRKNTSRTQSEEAKINAWENLQKAKAEAAIQKLEMKLEKKRSSAMDKILKKLRIAQTKAQEVRREISESPSNQAQSPTNTRTSRRVVSFRGYLKTVYLGRCFACDAY